MICDLDGLEDEALEHPIIVLGAGAVGIVLAVALARRGQRVLLCESGGQQHEVAATQLNAASVIGRAHRGISEGRARVLGGTTTLWGGQLIPFRDLDFQARPWLGLAAWPLTSDDLSIYYRAVLAMLGLDIVTTDDSAVWQALGKAQPTFGPDVDIILTRWLRQSNLAALFARELKSNPNITVLLHATAVGFSDAGCEHGEQRIGEVTVRSAAGRTIAIAAEVVVIATGTIEASRLMLAAAAARPGLAWAANPLVGKFFQDHLDLRVGDVAPIDKKRFHDIFDNIFIKGYKYNPKLVLAEEAQRRLMSINIAASFIFESSITEHLSNLKILLRALRNGTGLRNLMSLPRSVAALTRVWYPLVRRYLRDHRMFNPADLGIGLRVHIEQRPVPESTISLDPERVDTNGVPLAVLNWQVDGTELDTAASFSMLLKAELERQGLARVKLDPRLLARDPAMLDEASDTNHHCGGLRMGRNSSTGVVDADLRVFGTSNLFVAGAATFPSSSFANPTLTAMALALRLADRLSGRSATLPYGMSSNADDRVT